MLADVTLPSGVVLARTTPEFTDETVPDGLRRGHRVTAGVWGRLRVFAGSVTFVAEDSGESRVVAAGESQVIEPELRHHVDPEPGARFVVEFHR
jgi:tellurite resistance-related uncharacterized protein